MQPLISHSDRNEACAAQHVDGSRVAGAALHGEHPVDAQAAPPPNEAQRPGTGVRSTPGRDSSATS